MSALDIGSLARAQFKSWEASQVADIDGTEKASEVLRSALCSLERVKDKSSDFFNSPRGFTYVLKVKSFGGIETMREHL